MPRRKPISGKQKKEQQQIKRAIKRGDIPAPEPTKKPPRKRRPTRIGVAGKAIGHPTSTSDSAAASVRKLQSTFIKLPPRFLEETKAIASTVPLSRPIPDDVALFHDFTSDDSLSHNDPLSCPKRPKWRYDMSKKEVEHNEEGLFKKWLTQTDQLVEKWQKSREPSVPDPDEINLQYESPLLAPPSPTYFERNLEVWRQLWRVTEISQIILVLLDSRCPLLHFPPSLVDYLANSKVVLVLTKVDITGPVRVSAWIQYFNDRYPNMRIVQVESYAEKQESAVHQGRKQYEPNLPETFRQSLVDTIMEIHAEMLQPPEKVANNPEWLKRWVPPVKREIDWNTVMNASGGQVGTAVGGAAVLKPKPEEEEVMSQDPDDDKEPEILTIGLIGQPNVGKSSLLNALFGTQRVRASKTPGKTKHFQTLYWTRDVRLVDCPGIVMPSYVPMEMQVLSGILPISRVSAIPACINYVASFLPLEKIYKLNHPSALEVPVEDKRTWRGGIQPPKAKLIQWTAMDILTAFANSRGWLTAKAGRPDIHRAGNAILRAVAEARVSWAFWPLGTRLDVTTKENTEADAGIWISDREFLDEGSDSENEEGAVLGVRVGDGSESSSGSEGEEEEEFPESGSGRFGALQINGGESEEDEEDDDDEDDEE